MDLDSMTACSYPAVVSIEDMAKDHDLVLIQAPADLDPSALNGLQFALGGDASAAGLSSIPIPLPGRPEFAVSCVPTEISNQIVCLLPLRGNPGEYRPAPAFSHFLSVKRQIAGALGTSAAAEVGGAMAAPSSSSSMGVSVQRLSLPKYSTAAAGTPAIISPYQHQPMGVSRKDLFLVPAASVAESAMHVPGGKKRRRGEDEGLDDATNKVGEEKHRFKKHKKLGSSSGGGSGHSKDSSGDAAEDSSHKHKETIKSKSKDKDKDKRIKAIP